MSEDPLIPVPNPSDSLSQAAGNLLRQVADNPTAVRTVQITIHLEQPARNQPITVHAEAGTWMRRVLSDGQVVVSWVPDDASQTAEQEVHTADLAEKMTWVELLRDPPVDIDTGLAFLRLNPDSETGIARWLPNNVAEAEIRVIVEQGAGTPGGVDLRQFRNCQNQHISHGLSRVAAFRRCLHHLTS